MNLEQSVNQVTHLLEDARSVRVSQRSIVKKNKKKGWKRAKLYIFDFDNSCSEVFGICVPWNLCFLEFVDVIKNLTHSEIIRFDSGSCGLFIGMLHVLTRPVWVL